MLLEIKTTNLMSPKTIKKFCCIEIISVVQSFYAEKAKKLQNAISERACGFQMECLNGQVNSQCVFYVYYQVFSRKKRSIPVKYTKKKNVASVNFNHGISLKLSPAGRFFISPHTREYISGNMPQSQRYFIFELQQYGTQETGGRRNLGCVTKRDIKVPGFNLKLSQGYS